LVTNHNTDNTSRKLSTQIMLYHDLAVRFLGAKCNNCGRTEDLHIQHIDENWRNNDITNLKLLCKSCHLRMHRKNYLDKHSRDFEISSVTVRGYRHRTTIPRGIFKKLGLKDKDRLKWIHMKDGRLIIMKVPSE